MIDLHPVWGGDFSSQCDATDGTWFGGTAADIDRNRVVATLWKGTTPDSAINMDPPGSGFRSSWITGMAPGVQVGNAVTSTGKTHAKLWHGSPESIIDMHPSFSHNTNSYMYGTLGWIHIGQLDGRAGYWLGDDPDSFVSLHQYLPDIGSQWGPSHPYDIDVIDNKLIVAGDAASPEYRQHAIVWIGTPVNDTAKHFLKQTHGSKINP